MTAPREKELRKIESRIGRLLAMEVNDRQFIIDAIIRIVGTALDYDNLPEVPDTHAWYSALCDYNQSRKFPILRLTDDFERLTCAVGGKSGDANRAK